jgi:pimeloyl-ACP methyl ester carboxylesterase
VTNFVLVHGAWHGGWCWRRVVDRLQAKGHRVLAPSLTGLGDRAHLLSPQVGLSTHVDDIVGLLTYEDLDDVVLCGHSYGGMVITGVADRIALRLRSLVYLDALLPDDRQCAFDVLPPDRRVTFRKGAEESGDGWRMPPVPAERFGVTDPEDQTWVDRLCGPMPIRAFEEPLHLHNPAITVARRTYILAGNYDPSPFQSIYARLKEDPAWTCHRLPTGHDAMVTMPQELTELLLAEAE